MAKLTIQQTFELAQRHHQAGRLNDAELLYRQILAQEPQHPHAIHYLGTIAHQAGQLDAAVDLIRRAIALNPNYAEAQYSLGNALKARGERDQAIAAYRRAIAVKADFAEAYNNLGNTLKDAGQLDAAIAAYRQAIALKPNYSGAYNNLGMALHATGQLSEAITAYQQAIAITPNYFEAYSHLGISLKDQGQLDQAIAAIRQAIALNPNSADAYNNLGNALLHRGNVDQAITACRRAIALKPDCAEAHCSLGPALLARGEFAEGWAEYEWRWRGADMRAYQRTFAQPQWDGGPVDGRTILLHTEQCFGDTIQFIRYLPLVMQRGGPVIVECPPELRRLVQAMTAAVTVVTKGQTLPSFDLHCPLLSLPSVLGTTMATIPHTVPYLRADTTDIDQWRPRLAAPLLATKVGLVWAGRPTHRNDRNRSIKLANLEPLAAIPGAHLYSLQKGDAAAEAKTAPPGMELIDLAAELHDFSDSAAAVANLDLVIAVDTAVAHLAGAMAKPVWTLLPYVAEWRWLMERDDSPWYPTMRLFRQTRVGDWDGVILRVKAALAELVQRR